VRMGRRRILLFFYCDRDSENISTDVSGMSLHPPVTKDGMRTSRSATEADEPRFQITHGRDIMTH